MIEDGVRLFYEKVGNGEMALVILNGFLLFNVNRGQFIKI